MGYVTGYEHDIFISYAHIDNTPFGTEKGWVTAFVDDLKNYLDRGLGCRDVSIWMDRELTCNEAFAGSIEDALRNSATLLVVASPGYLGSEWCKRERNAFHGAVREKARSGSRMFRVDLDDLNRDDLPAEIGAILPCRFWAKDRNGNPRTLGMPVCDATRGDDYISELTRLRVDLARELKRLKSLHSSDAVSPLASPAIYLAEVTDDLDGLRDELDAYAKQAGLRVLPEAWYPRDDMTEYRRRMTADLAQSKAYVQLLGGLPGKRPPGWPMRLPAVQCDAARQAGLPILQWRAREVDLDSVKQTCPEHYELLMGADVRMCGTEEFKRAVIDEALRPARKATEKKSHASDIHVFVNSATPDLELARAVCKLLGDEGIGSSLPLSDESAKVADVREDLETQLSTCDGLILVYGSAPVAWVRRQYAQGRKIISQRESPLIAMGLVDGPPPEKAGVDFQVPNMHSLDWRNGIRPDILREFIAALRG